MPHDHLNDDARPQTGSGPAPDPHGQAALLLAEATLHALVENGALTASQAIEAARTASEVKEEVARANAEPEATLRASQGLLARIETSLSADDPERSRPVPDAPH